MFMVRKIPKEERRKKQIEFNSKKIKGKKKTTKQEIPVHISKYEGHKGKKEIQKEESVYVRKGTPRPGITDDYHPNESLGEFCRIFTDKLKDEFRTGNVSVSTIEYLIEQAGFTQLVKSKVDGRSYEAYTLAVDRLERIFDYLNTSADFIEEKVKIMVRRNNSNKEFIKGRSPDKQ